MYLADSGQKRAAVIGVGLNFVPVVGPLLSTAYSIFGGPKKSKDQKNAEFLQYMYKFADPRMDWEAYLARYPDVFAETQNNPLLWGSDPLAYAAYHYSTSGKKEGRVAYAMGSDPLRQQAEAQQPQTQTIMQDAPAPASPAPVTAQPVANPAAPAVSSRTYADDADHYVDEYGRWINRHTGYDERTLNGLKFIKLNGLGADWINSQAGRDAVRYYGSESAARANRQPGYTPNSGGGSSGGGSGSGVVMTGAQALRAKQDMENRAALDRRASAALIGHKANQFRGY